MNCLLSPLPSIRRSQLPAKTPPAIEAHTIRARFLGKDMDTRVLDRRSMKAGESVPGPAIIVQRDTTMLIEPGYRATDSDIGSIMITKEN